MLKIAVVDDEVECIDKLALILEQYFQAKQIKYKIFKYQNGEDFLNNDIVIDLLFLDIQMNGVDGIKTGQLFRSKNVRTTLIYVTSYPDYIMQSMLVHPFAFVVKPYQNDEIIRNLDDFLEYYHKNTNKSPEETIKVYDEEKAVIVKLSDILYFHYLSNRQIRVITNDTEYSLRGNMTNLYENISNDSFIFPHQSFIININYIKSIDGKNKAIKMENDDVVLIARGRYKEIMQFFNQKYGR